MGKHKEKKSKKSKKNKKEKRSKKIQNHGSSDGESSSGEGEVVWTEAGGSSTTTAAFETSKSADQLKPEKEDSEDENLGGENDWLGFIDSKSKGNVKLAHLKRNIVAREQATADNKIRYARELNSYFRDDASKKFIEDPETYWKDKSKSKKLETDSESDGSEDDGDKEYANSDDDREPPAKPVPKVKKLTDNERNAINAKIVKAEMLGKKELVAELKATLKEAEEADNDLEEEEVHYTVKSKKTAAERAAAEEKMSVKEMYLSTKSSISSRGEAARFVASSSKLRPKYDDEYEEVKGRKKKLKVHHDQFERVRTDTGNSSEKCNDCLEKFGRHLSLRFDGDDRLEHLYVAFTPSEPFTPHYCQIRSRSHSAANNSVEADESLWTELRTVMRRLVGFFERHFNLTLLFMETHFVGPKRSQNISRRHLVIEVVPLKKRYEADARIYFHKAILETGEEWATNRKLIKLEGRPVTKVIPKGLAYFWVSFGADFEGGFAHVIEDEDYFSKDFGKEVIGGLRDIEPSRWKRPRGEDYDRQMHRLAEVKEKWSAFTRGDMAVEGPKSAI